MTKKIVWVLECILVSFIFSQPIYGEEIIFAEDLEGKSIIYRALADGKNLEKIGPGSLPQWSPDRKIISYVAPSEVGNEVVGIGPDMKEIFRVRGILGSILFSRWNPDGKSIALVAALKHLGTLSPEANIISLDIKSYTIEILFKIPMELKDIGLPYITLDWSPDGKNLLFSAISNDLDKKYDIFMINPSRKEARSISKEGILPRFLSNNKIVYVLRDEIWIVDTDLNSQRKLLTIGLRAPFYILFGDLCREKMILSTICSSEDSALKLYLLNLKNETIDRIRTPGHVLNYPIFSPDCQKFSATGYRLTPEKKKMGGYFTFDLKHKEISLLKSYEEEISGEFQPFIFLMQYRNHSCWK